jgi:8-oxo-dGTP diphosphatase
MELWDLYDSNRQPLHRTHQRGKIENPGEYHIVVEVWTVNSKKNVLITLRDPSKETYPDKWENTGGSAITRETSRQAAVRELFEETGIKEYEDDLTLLGTVQEESDFVDVYLLFHDAAISQLTMQQGETVAAKWVTIEQLDEMISNESLALPVGKRLNLVRDNFELCLESL